MQQAISSTGSPLELLVGSLRNPDQLLALARLGVRNVTIAPSIWSAFFAESTTADVVQRFHELASR